MVPFFDIKPAHAARACVRPLGDGVILGAVFYQDGEHGIELIHIPDGQTVYIPFTDIYRVGRVYSVFLTPFDSAKWLYRYKSCGRWIPDPHAYGLRRVKIMGNGIPQTVLACSCDPLRPENLSEQTEEGPEYPLPPADWTKQVIYSLHVRGYTAMMPGEQKSLRGTFSALVSRIPYLQDLGVTAVELMPVYTPFPLTHRSKSFRTMQEALGAWPVGPSGDPMRDMKERPNYWGFGQGLYYALRPEYGTQKEFAQMVRAFHKAGIRVLLQVYFDKGVQIPDQIRILRFYVRRFGIDGFRLTGNVDSAAIAASPSLADTALLYHSFPFRELEEEREASALFYETDLESLPETTMPALAADKDTDDTCDSSCAESRTKESSQSMPSGKDLLRLIVGSGASRRSAPAAVYAPVRFSNLITCSDEFQTLLRRFVKSDDYVMTDFLKLFLGAPENHPDLRYVTSCDGFTLADLVSYNDRHNEENGEFGLDGCQENFSWNCGEEGETEDEEILRLRRKQVRNFLTLVMLSRGTPVLLQGDERFNTQGGNNNPYCQDNETTWIDWTPSPERDQLTKFTTELISFRRDHPVFTGTKPFQYIDYLNLGYADVSLHGTEAWNPDLGPSSHSIGIAYCENYAQTENSQLPAFTYLAVNMYWQELSLALPGLPRYYIWKVFMDTETEEGFLAEPLTVPDQDNVNVSPRSVQILQAVFDMEEFLRREKIKEMEASSLAGDKNEQELPEQEGPGQELCEKTDSEKAEGEQTVPEQAEGEQMNPGQTSPEQGLSEQPPCGQTDSDQVDCREADSDQVDCREADSDQVESGQADPDQTARGQEDCGQGPQKQFSPEE